MMMIFISFGKLYEVGRRRDPRLQGRPVVFMNKSKRSTALAINTQRNLECRKIVTHGALIILKITVQVDRTS
jgi:hypothetical protein